ncbi:MAG: hypothetical protein U0X93_07885 [Anaerolineales bacterium]
MTSNRRWFGTVREMTETLVSIPSVSPSVEAENRCAEKIRDELLVDSLDQLWETNDGRKIVACLLKSENPKDTGKTIILLSHFDTVGVDDFPALATRVNLAFQPDELRRSCVNFEQKDLLTESDRVIALQSGEWMFGRGSVDMKVGRGDQYCAHARVCAQAREWKKID